MQLLLVEKKSRICEKSSTGSRGKEMRLQLRIVSFRTKKTITHDVDRITRIFLPLQRYKFSGVLKVQSVKEKEELC